MRQSIFKISYISLLLIVCSLSSYAQNERIKALFIYNFTKYIEWPEDYKEGDFIIGILGETPIFDQLVQNTATRKVATQSIVVKKFNKISEIEKCHILYVPAKYSSLKEITNAINKWAVLLITETVNGINEGAGLNFININGKSSFEINTEVLNKKGLAYNSSLLKLGIQVK